MHRERALRCELGATLAPRAAAGAAMPVVVEEHMTTCLRCQAEVARHRRARRQLRALAVEEVVAPPGAVDAVLAFLDDAADPADATRWPTTSVVATAAGAAAGVGVWVWRRRQAG